MKQTQKTMLTSGVLVLVASGLGAYAVFGVQKPEEQKEAAKTKADTVFDGFDKEHVKALEVKAKGSDVQLMKDGKDWKVTSPVKADADVDVVNALLAKLGELKRKSTVDEKPADLAKFGLAPPKVSVTATLDDGKKLELAIGEDNGFDSSVYFKRGDLAQVDAGESSLKAPLEKNLFDLRDKRLVHVDDADVKGLAVKLGQAAYTLERGADGKWTIALPVKERADSAAADRLLSQLKNARATSVAAESASGAELAKFGLDKPRGVVTLTVGDKAVKTFAFGVNKTGTTAHDYVQVNGAGPVLEVEASLSSQFEKPLFELRDKLVATFDKDAVKRVAIELAGQDTIEYTRTKPASPDGGYVEEQFAIVKPHAAEAKKWKCSGALYALSNLRAAAFVDEHADAKALARFGLDKPARTYTVYGDADKVLARIKVGKLEGTRYFVQEGGSTRVDAVEKATVDDLPKSLDDLVEKPAEKAAAPSAPFVPPPIKG